MTLLRNREPVGAVLPYTVLVLEKQAVPQDSILPRCS